MATLAHSRVSFVNTDCFSIYLSFRPSPKPAYHSIRRSVDWLEQIAWGPQIRLGG
jgi:hypothetical protein